MFSFFLCNQSRYSTIGDMFCKCCIQLILTVKIFTSSPLHLFLLLLQRVQEIPRFIICLCLVCLICLIYVYDSIVRNNNALPGNDPKQRIAWPVACMYDMHPRQDSGGLCLRKFSLHLDCVLPEASIACYEADILSDVTLYIYQFHKAQYFIW